MVTKKKGTKKKQVEGGIAPLVAARYAAQAAEIIYDLLPEDAKEWVDENLGINWAKKNVLAPVAEAALDIKENWKDMISDPKYFEKRADTERRERLDEDAQKTLDEQREKGWIFTCNDEEKGAFDCLKNRTFLQYNDPKNPSNWWFKYDPLTGEELPKAKSLSEMTREYGDKVAWDGNQKRWLYTAGYQRLLDRESAIDALDTEEEKQALRDQYAEEDAAAEKQRKEAEWANTARFVQSAQEKQNREAMERYAKSVGKTVEQVEAENAAFDADQRDDNPPEEQPPDEDQQQQDIQTGAGTYNDEYLTIAKQFVKNAGYEDWDTLKYADDGEHVFQLGDWKFKDGNDLVSYFLPDDYEANQQTGAGWDEVYGRQGFFAGVLGGNRPINSYNKPVINISKDDYRNRYFPQHFVNKKNQIVLWENDYSEPAPIDEQLVRAREKKRRKNNARNETRRQESLFAAFD